MALGSRQEQVEELAERVITALRVVIDTVDDDWGVRVETHGDTTLSERFAELIQHWGFLSRPAKDSEGVMLLDESGAAIVGTRAALPSTVTNDLPTSGNTMLYNSNGKRIYMKDGKIQLHPDGSLLAVARDTDDCTSNTSFDNWALAVETQIVVGGGGAVGPWGVKRSLADITATSTVVESG